MQSLENIWLNLKYLGDLKCKASEVFNNVKYAQCYMPSYTSGQLGLLIATMDTAKDLTNPLRKFSREKNRNYLNIIINKFMLVHSFYQPGLMTI